MKHFQTPTPQNTLRRRLTTYFVALTGACLTMLPHGLYAYDSLSSPLPIEIKVPAGHMPFLWSDAIGTQNYMCLPFPLFPLPLPRLCLDPLRAAGDPVQRLWDTNYHPFSEPQPGAGRTRPRATWLVSRNTSAVWAKDRILPRTRPLSSGSGAIPWLLLEVVGTELGPTGGHRLTGTTYIQRVNTKEAWRPPLVVSSSNVGMREFVPLQS